jgi:ADP-ribose pyrophosphatase YjhB (NUDIX family)
MLYPNKAGFIEQGFLAVRIVLAKTENGKRYFLMKKRTIVPYKGTYGTPGDKIMFGEDVADAAKRAMEQHTGLTCDIELRGIRHVKDRHQGNIMQDKYFFIFAASNPRGELLPSSRSGDNVWLTYEELESSGLSIHGGLEILRLADDKNLHFSEATLDVEIY